MIISYFLSYFLEGSAIHYIQKIETVSETHWKGLYQVIFLETDSWLQPLEFKWKLLRQFLGSPEDWIMIFRNRSHSEAEDFKKTDPEEQELIT